jgi:hypothetical protein
MAEFGFGQHFTPADRCSDTAQIHGGSHMKGVLVISAMLLLSGSSALAEGAARACVSDIRTLCGGVQPGQGRIAGCVKERFKDLSEPCQNLLATTAAGAKACAADLKQNCAEARRRAARVACIRSSLANLGDACKSALARVAAAGK